MNELPAPTRSRLTRQKVLDAALRLVDSDGADALTMRRLGQALDCDPMALYRYAENRAALLDGVAETVLARLAVPADGHHWETRLRATAHDFRRLALAHPNVVPLIVARPLSTPLALRPVGTLRPLEQILALLVGAGFAPDQALHVYRAYFGLLHGHVLNELQALVVDPEATDALLRLGLDRLPAEEFPHIRSVADALLDGYDGKAELDRGLDILLDGVRAERPAASPSSRRPG
jgi:AcrR family transcriptional regulator